MHTRSKSALRNWAIWFAMEGAATEKAWCKAAWCSWKGYERERENERDKQKKERKRDARMRVRVRKRGFCARPARLDISPLPSGNSSATSRASRRLHHTYAAEHYITENDEPGVQSPGTLASSTCVMRRAQRAAANNRLYPELPKSKRTILFHPHDGAWISHEVLGI